MVVIFTKQNSNYTQQNIIDILSVINHPTLNYLIHSQRDYIKVVGDIHRSQFTSDNPENYFWLKIQAYVNDMLLPEFRAVHVYVCFRQFTLDYRTGQYVTGGCINPEGRTDVADISGLMGYWQFKKITYGLSPKVPVRRVPSKPVKKRERKRLQIIDPKTGKPVQIGGSHHNQQGGGLRKEKVLKFVIKKYSPTTERDMKKLKTDLNKEVKKIDFMKDPEAGVKLEKIYDEKIFELLKKINKMKVEEPEKIKTLEEFDDAIKNEYPYAYGRLKAKKLRRVVHKISKNISSSTQKLKQRRKSIRAIAKNILSRKSKKKSPQIGGKIKKRVKSKSKGRKNKK